MDPQIQAQDRQISQREQYHYDQELNEEGGYSFVVPEIERVKRFLCLGSELSYYRAHRSPTGIHEFELTDVTAIDSLIGRGEGREVVHLIRTISRNGRACRQNPSIYALAVCAKSNCRMTKHAAYSVLNDVCRIPTHLFLFIKYCEEMSDTETGWGRAHRMAISNWYKQFIATDVDSPKHPVKLAYLVTKYQRRHRFSHKDVLRLAHVQTKHKAIRLIIQYILGKEMENVENDNTAIIVRTFIQSIQRVKRCQKQDEETLCDEIALHNLSREHVPNIFLNNIKVWEVLIRTMPMTAMIRNLGKITSLAGRFRNEFWIELAEVKLGDEIKLALSCIHPLNLLIAKKHYETGISRRETFRWEPHPRICNALDNAFINLTRLTKPTGKRYLMAVSIGEAMDQKICGSTIKAREAAAAMVLSTITHVKPGETREVPNNNVEVILFRDSIEEAYIAKIDQNDDLKSIEDKMFHIPRRTGLDGDKNDLMAPFKWAADRREKFDAIIVFTDSITSIGLMHPAESLRQYRQYMAVDNCRLVVVAMATDRYTIAAPDDTLTLDVVGFDTHTPGIIMGFIDRFEQENMENEDVCLHEEYMDIH